MMTTRLIVFLLTALIIGACGGEEPKSKEESNASFKEKAAARFGLTVFELDNGVGPIKENIELKPVNKELAAMGEKLFIEKCSQCHKLDERYTGPAIRNASKDRSPEYILNMILNPEEMTKKHPEAKKMLAMYANQMTFQNVTQDDAFKLLEYLRSVSNN
ncbi:MAG: cytochrome c [Bacteroidetes bacterium]|nr:cytochrome c [Bacteroidota bacterium]